MLDRLREDLAGRYDVIREAGRGGMAVVYEARDLKHDRIVALKVMRPELRADLAADRFLNEIRISSGLNHPHIVTLIDSGEAAGTLFYVTPFLGEPTLRARIDRDGALPLTDALEIARDIASALAHAHSHGIVHRDIKPENILMAGREAIVADFGIARAFLASADARVTQTGFGVGTVHYMAPEQAFGSADSRSDIYSLGCTLFEMVTGRSLSSVRSTPSDPGSIPGVLPPVRESRIDAPAALERLVARATALNPSDRYQTATELLEALERVAATVGSGSGYARNWTAPGSRLRLAVAGVAVVVLAVGIARWSKRDHGPAPRSLAVFPFQIPESSGDTLVTPQGLVELLYARLSSDSLRRTVHPRLVEAAVSARKGALPDGDLDARRAIARQLGATELLTATATRDSGRLTITAAVISVASGKAVHSLSASGATDSALAVVTALANELLIREAGPDAIASLPDLLSQNTGALVAYLRGSAEYRRGRYARAMAEYRAALARDSTFALAAIELSTASVMAGSHSANTDALNAAWRFRDRLDARNARYLRLIAGPRFPAASSSAEHLADWDAFIADVPDRWEAAFFRGDRLFHEGDYAGATEPRARAREAFRRVLAIDSVLAPALEHAIDLAILDGDSTEVRQLASRYFTENAGGDNTPYIRWRVSTFLADGSVRFRLRDELPRIVGASLTKIAAAAQLAGVGLADAQLANAETLRRAVESSEVWIGYWNSRSLAFNMGKPAAAARWTMDTPAGFGLPVDLLLRVLEATEFGGDSTIAARAIAREATATAAAIAAVSPLATRDAYRVCAAGVWRLTTGDLDGSGAAARRLRSVLRPTDKTSTTFVAICAAMIEAQLAVLRNRPDAGQTVDRLDSLLSSGPTTNPTLRAVAALRVSRLLERTSEPARALAAVRRRPIIFDMQGTDGLAQLLREEGRLALLTADTAGAVRAYEHYVAFRGQAEPPVAADVATVRLKLQSLGRPAMRRVQ